MSATPDPVDRPKIAAAGPLVTAAIAALCFGLGTLLVGADEFSRAMVFDARDVAQVAVLLADLCAINIVLLVFNLLPGFPLDGGRIVRALAWWRTGDRDKATRIMAATGRGPGVDPRRARRSWAILQAGHCTGLWSILPAVHDRPGRRLRRGADGGGEPDRAPARGRRHGLRACRDAGRADRGAALEEYFLRYGWDWFPVVDARGTFAGLVEREQVDEGRSRASARVADVVAPDPATTRGRRGRAARGAARLGGASEDRRDHGGGRRWRAARGRDGRAGARALQPVARTA